MADLTGRQLGQYRILEPLGQGGMATVYRAEQIAIGRQVAVKVIKGDLAVQDEFLQRFEREAALIATLSHPHILKIFDYGRADDILYLVTELLRGGSLGRLIQSEPLELGRIASLLDQMAGALDYAHSRNVIHRDLKPQNILLDETGNAFLADFGIAKLIGDSASALTMSGSIVGTPAYIAPEIWRGQAVDSRSDLYALGVLLYEMLTKRVPFAGDTPYNLMYKHLHETPQPPTIVRADLPPEVSLVLTKALAKQPAARFPTARLLAEAFRSAALPIEPRPKAAPPPDMEGPTAQITPPLVPSKTPATPRTPVLPATPRPKIPTDKLDDATFAVTPALRQAQEEQALAQIATEALKRTPPEARPRSRIINLLPQDAGDRFRDRVRQQADIVSLLTEQTRLVSIYGRAGVGKSALASRALGNLHALKGADAVQGIVALSAGTTGLSVDRIMADFLRLLDGEARETVEQVQLDPAAALPTKVNALLTALGGGRYILLLDNLEAVQKPEVGDITDPDLRTFIDTAIGQASGLRLLVTSREPLTLPRTLKTWERLIPLEEGLPDADAVALLRALDADGTIGLSTAPDSVLTTLATRLRGFPRALEAAVGLLLEDPFLTVDELVADAALFNAEITAIIVQQAIAQLSPGAVRVMEALSLFGRPVPQTGLEYLLAPFMDTAQLRATLARLVRGYFASYNKATQTFAIHKIDEAYCLSRIPLGDVKDAQGDALAYSQVALHHRAADYYARNRYPEDQWTGLAALGPQLAEFEHRVAAMEYDAAADLLESIDASALFRWGAYRTAVELHEQIRGKVQESRKRVRHLRFLGSAYRLIGRAADALSALELSLSTAQGIGDRGGEHAALNALSVTNMELYRIGPAIGYAERAQAIVHELGERDKESYILCNLALLYGLQGRTAAALASIEQALAIARELNDREGEGLYMANLAELLTDAGRYEDAIQRAAQAELVGVELSSPEVISISCYASGQAYLFIGNLSAARDAVGRGLSSDYVPNNHAIQALHGLICLRMGDRAAAAIAFAKVVEIAAHGDVESADLPSALGLAHCGQALLGEEKSIPQAIEAFRKAHTAPDSAGAIARDHRLVRAFAPVDPGGLLHRVLEVFDDL